LVHVKLTRNKTIWAKESRRSVNSFYMLTQAICSIEACGAGSIGNWVNIVALVWGKLKVLGIDVSL